MLSEFMRKSVINNKVSKAKITMQAFSFKLFFHIAGEVDVGRVIKFNRRPPSESPFLLSNGHLRSLVNI